MEPTSIIKRYIITALLLLTVVGCNSQSKETPKEENIEVSYLVVDANSFKEKMANEENIQLIDVRTKAEYDLGTISSAINYDYLDGTFEKSLNQLDKSKTVYVFCARGGRSGKASKLLEENGFTRIVDLQGGYTAWQLNEKE